MIVYCNCWSCDYREVSHDQLCLAVVTVMSHRLNCRTHADAAFTSLNSLRINHEKQEVMKFKHGDKGGSLRQETF